MRIAKSTVIRHFGSQQATADAFKITKQAVSSWEKYIPPLRAFEFKEMLNGSHKYKRGRKSPGT